jgi:hypothetical protein
MWSAGQGDNQERFLADFRALRDAAALGYDELAARAHFPSSILKEAENGPGLPGLPILAAYVRACDADVPEWEERWRRLAYAAETDPGLPVRPAGASPAAVAGARAGITVAPPDAYDPERIRAALRGGTADHAARGAGQPRAAAPGRADPAPVPAAPVTPEGPAAWTSATSWSDSVWDGGSGRAPGPGWENEARWDTASSWNTVVGQDTAPTNGNHHAPYVFDAPVTEAFVTGVRSPVTVDETEPTQWSLDSELAASVTEDSELDRRPADSGYAVREDAPPAPEPTRDTEPAAAAAPSVVAGSAGMGGSAEVAGAAEVAGVAGVAGAASVAGAMEVAVGAGDAESAGVAGTSGVALAEAATQPVRAQVPAPAPAEPARDRFFPLRLIAVMVVAAIIGSVLVLLIR